MAGINPTARFEFPSDLPPIPDDPYIFLGGTCGGNDWRTEFNAAIRYCIPQSEEHVAFAATQTYDPRVKNWTATIARSEIEVKDKATGLIFYLGDPNDQDSNASMYSGAEAMFYATTRPRDTAVILEVSPYDETHADKQRKHLADFILQECPETTVAWCVLDAVKWAACKLTDAPYEQELSEAWQDNKPWYRHNHQGL